ncbi:MAG TPA: hypothetical protein PLX06_02310 [Fimbriimonadaceae bacterium]|nr:hypothetical protein [Fimbriimonadaceae bacterium]
MTLFLYSAHHSTAQISSTPTSKSNTVQSHDATCKVEIRGLGDGTYMTGTGVSALYIAKVIVQPTPPNGWYGHLDSVELTIGDKTAQIYPIPTDPAAGQLMDFARSFRYDSTDKPCAADGTTTVNVKLRAYFHFVKYGPPPPNPPGGDPPIIASEPEVVEIDVNPKVINIASFNATSRDLFGAPAGWQAMSPLPNEYLWSSVSQLGATEARGQLTNANYALAEGDLHPYSSVALSQAEFDGAGNPQALRALQLTKLLGKSTLWFNSSHGESGGFNDNSDPLQLVDWASCLRTVGEGQQGSVRNLMCRFAFLYSCLCAKNPASVMSAFRMGQTNAAISNSGFFGFNEFVFSTLYEGNSQPDQPYNQANGGIIMTDQLSQHAKELLTEMARGTKAEVARVAANDACPPRKFSHGANGVNYTDPLPMMFWGDHDATLRTIYRKSTELGVDFLQFGSWGLLERALKVAR